MGFMEPQITDKKANRAQVETKYTSSIPPRTVGVPARRDGACTELYRNYLEDMGCLSSKQEKHSNCLPQSLGITVGCIRHGRETHVLLGKRTAGDALRNGSTRTTHRSSRAFCAPQSVYTPSHHFVYLPCGEGARLAVGTRAFVLPSELIKHTQYLATRQIRMRPLLGPRSIKHKRTLPASGPKRMHDTSRWFLQGCATHDTPRMFRCFLYQYFCHVRRRSHAKFGRGPRDIAPRTGNQPSFAKHKTAQWEVALTATANGYEK